MWSSGPPLFILTYPPWITSSFWGLGTLHWNVSRYFISLGLLVSLLAIPDSAFVSRVTFVMINCWECPLWCRYRCLCYHMWPVCPSLIFRLYLCRCEWLPGACAKVLGTLQPCQFWFLLPKRLQPQLIPHCIHISFLCWVQWGVLGGKLLAAV